MWNPIEIEIENLFAHVESKYFFKNNTCTVIFGKNETDKGFENNGAGKTTLFEAICIALTNESLRNIKKDNFINRDSDKCKIMFSLYNPVLRMNLKIIRQFFRGGKAAKVEIYENDKLNTQVVSVNEANKRILELIGISREDLLRYYIISQDNHYTFFTASDTEKKEIMNRITSADMINPIVQELDLKLYAKQAEYDDIKSSIDKFTENKETLEEQRLELLNNDDNVEVVNELKNKILEQEEKIKGAEEQIREAEKKKKEAEKKKKKIPVKDSSSLKKQYKIVEKQYNEEYDKCQENKRLKKKLENEINDAVICPHCGEKFILKSELDITIGDAKRLLKELNKELKKQSEKINNINEESSKILREISECEYYEEKFEELDNIVNLNDKRIRIQKERIEEIREKINRIEEDIKETREQKEKNNLVKKLTDKIKGYTDKIKGCETKIKPIENELEMIKFWRFNMGKNGFMTYLANKSVKIIEGITNSYLRKFGVDISVLINGFTILRSGEVREKIDVFVSNDGITADNFMAKSGGERGRVMLAGVLGIQHLINLSTNGKGLNLLCFDECFSGMDARGQENVIKIFEKMGITILVITQNVSESFNNENTLYVIKEKGVSKYISQS